MIIFLRNILSNKLASKLIAICFTVLKRVLSNQISIERVHSLFLCKSAPWHQERRIHEHDYRELYTGSLSRLRERKERVHSKERPTHLDHAWGTGWRGQHKERPASLSIMETCIRQTSLLLGLRTTWMERGWGEGP